MNFPEVCKGHMRKLHILLLLLRMLKSLQTQAHIHMQHVCCLVCNVFQSVANMVLATEKPQENYSVVAKLFLLWWAYWTHSAEGLLRFNHCTVAINLKVLFEVHIACMSVTSHVG